MRWPGRRLRILTLTHNYPRFSGDPAGAFVARIAQGAARVGHQVVVVAPHAPGIATSEELEGVKVHRFRYAPESLERIAYTGGLHQGTLRSPVSALSFPGFLLTYAATIRSVSRALRPDIVHAHWWIPNGWLASWSKTPYLITCHGSDVRLLEGSGLMRWAARRVFRKASRLTTVSRFLSEDIKRMLPGIVRDPTVTPMPVDVRRFEAGAAIPKAQPPRILYAGNLVPLKGVDLLLRAAAELARAGMDYQVKILGQGPAEGSLRELTDQLGLADRVTWSPFVPQEQMPSEYGASTVTVLPSRGKAEGLGLTLVEALLAGSAVVGSAAGGIPEVVRHEKTGLLAREGDAADLARQIARLLKDSELRARLTGAGKDHARRTYSPEATIVSFLELYDVAARR